MSETARLTRSRVASRGYPVGNTPQLILSQATNRVAVIMFPDAVETLLFWCNTKTKPANTGAWLPAAGPREWTLRDHGAIVTQADIYVQCLAGAGHVTVVEIFADPCDCP